MEQPTKACPAPHCAGQIYVGQYESTIRVPAQDDDGFPVMEPDGTLVKVVLRLPRHVSQFVSQFRPGQPETYEERAARNNSRPFRTLNYRGDDA